MTQEDVKELLAPFGKVLEARIIQRQGTNLNYSFVIFEDEKTAQSVLEQRPISLPDGHRLNVEEKKVFNRPGPGGAGRGAMGGDRGRGRGLPGGMPRGGGRGGGPDGGVRGGGRGGGRGGYQQQGQQQGGYNNRY